ncbi:hypothetical protein JXA40_10015 [bacterium]|nr:hypothetical protein [candidate division CSSED10-310 bacterium]
MIEKLWRILLIGSFFVAGALADEYYQCPYSGPTDDVELAYSAEHYALSLELTFPAESQEGALFGSVTIDGISLSDDLDRIALDFLDVETVEIFTIHLDGSTADHQFENHEIAITVPVPKMQGELFQVIVEYRIEGLKHFQFRPRGEERYAFNSMVANSRWFPCLHDPRDKATYEFTITVPSGKTAVANGLLQSIIDNGDRTETYRWVESDPMATYLATINVADYEVYRHDYNGMPVVYYIVGEKMAAAQYDFAHDHDILDFFTSAFGPYPFDKLGLADVPLGGAMENQDMISFGTNLITGDRTYEDTFAHEISHMWWGDSVTLTGCFDVWLNEGFASYCEALWEEHFYGQEAYDAVMAAHRDKYFSEDETHRYSIYDPEVVWSATTYKKAAWVLHMLRWVLGESDFWALLPDYYDRFKYGHATTDDFQAVCEDHYGSSLEWFFQEWIYDQGYPEFELAYRIVKDGEYLQMHVKQVQQDAPAVFVMPVEIEWTGTGGQTCSEIVWIDESEELFRFEIVEDLNTVAFDPREKILKKVEWTAWTAETGVKLWMPGTMFHAGEPCACSATVLNAEIETLENYPLFVILDVFGQYYFAPSFSDFDNFLSCHPTFPIGYTAVSVLPEFAWPAGAGTVAGVRWYAGLTNPGMTALCGTMDIWEFGWDS